MAKKIIQDIIVDKRNIKLVHRSNMSELAKLKNEEDARSSKSNFAKKLFPERKKLVDQMGEEEHDSSKNSKIFIWTISILCVATLLFFLSSVFATATVTITPKVEHLTLNDTYTISTKKEVAGLHYQIVTIKKDVSKSLETNGQADVQRKAIGKAILYNNFSTSKQRLINNTRLESSTGLVYRIRQSVDVPGIKTVAGVKTPGSIEVEIIADMPGDTYNIKVSDFKGYFKIPGFKGSTKYDGFYGRLSADTVGGYIGTVKTVSDTSLSAGKDELKNTLKADLIKEVYSKMPAQYVIFKDNYFVEFVDLQDLSEGNNYTISEGATIYAVMFDKKELAGFIAKNKLTAFDGSDVDALWNNNIVVSLTGTTEKPWTEDSLKVNFSGDVNIVWTYNTDEIINSISGQDKSIVNDVIDKNKNSITQIQVSIKPQWQKTFPTDINKIHIVDSVRDSFNK